MRRLLLVILLLLSAAGCSSSTTATPVAPCDPGPRGTRTVEVGKRSFIMHVPRDLVTPAPVVFNFHGRGSNAEEELLYTGMTQESEGGRFILVLPDGINGRWDLRGGDDAYLQAVYDAVPCKDTSRVYASGMSMGSAMTFYLACQPDRKFAAFGGVALAVYSPKCAAAPPAPIIYFHGTKDQVVKYRGGRAGGTQYVLPPVPKAMRGWASHNGCADKAVTDKGKDVVLTQWSGCSADASIDFYRIDGGGHTWPGTDRLIASATKDTLGRTTQTVDASALMWKFFQQYTLAQ